MTSRLMGEGDVVMLSGLERQVLEAAALGRVVEEPESAPAVAAVDRSHRRRGGDADRGAVRRRPAALQVELTAAGRMLLRSR